MSDLGVIRTYLVSYPRLTLVFLAFNTIAAAIVLWPYGVVAVMCGVAIFALLTLVLKFVLLLWFHKKLFDFPRRIGAGLLSILLLAGAAAVLQFPLYRQMCATNPTALGQPHLCAELAP